MTKPGEGSLSAGGRKKRKRSLEERVCKALAANRHLDASQIGVQIHGERSEAILIGTVPTDEQRRLAETCARAVRGITAVDNRLSVVGDGNRSK